MGEEQALSVVKVLFVDDEKNIVRALTRLFMEESFEVLTATSGQEGLECLEENDNIGLIVSDQRMPGMSGVEFLEKARKKVPEALRIVLTGYADVDAAMGAINRGGAFRYITKPWDDEQLLQDIREAVDLYQLKQENKRMAGVIREQKDKLAEWNKSLQTRVKEQTRDLYAKNKEMHDINKMLKRNFENTIRAFSNLMEMRDKRSGRHAEKVSLLSEKMAQHAGLTDADSETVRIAALLHDIGKIATGYGTSVVNFVSQDDAEKGEYLLHSVRGQSAVDSIENLRGAGILIRYHHELFSGSGFPDGLKGDRIPIGARIIGLADYFDRMINVSNATLDSVLAQVRNQLPVMFDPDLYSFLEELVHSVYLLEQKQASLVQKELNPMQLKEGLVLATDILSGTGVFLLGRGTALNTQNISALKRYFRLDPPVGGVKVWCEQ